MVVILGVLGGALTGCGSEATTSAAPDKSATTKAFKLTGHVFSDSHFGFNFTYPKDWREGEAKDEADQSAGGKPVARAAVGIDNDNGLLLLRYDLSDAVASAPLADQVTELNGIVTQFSGKPSSGTTTEIGGLRAVTYDEFPLVDDPGKRSSRIFFLFDGNAEYEVNCQWTAEGRDKINQGCDQMVATLRKK